ncbi:MAG: phosphoenolpyruvate--protein phosphotransferase [Candidatus Cloacimonetes bacterium]|jgi:phosphotransferase system enzyme I (PtsI)|nr:phosphoenolpyruvate--protein phosphotransferase [Candidatus Cloacimonadota bacterium]MCB5287599.1 phosphoenolpyruvate--protein phosphotransferase [Candidatus Cloacimonadota bacterium]MCK9184558.1 phosphoenolpyruvate--protein phosphotransferase [Candidatus Cloacimonadota bacterium]MCK9584757.1 phosphoenolpyruvate--protein phosphotransferase [Candidatus Cloacimonadota bacterium]MDY0229921.1 phosphoenolpyruvate--protein phosphotransferase [Candidatus Cloacimonadaceae bacterium]
MKTLKGTGIAKGLAFGKATYIKGIKYEIPAHSISKEQSAAELAMFHEALGKSRLELQDYLQADHISDSEKEILGTHLEIVNDPDLKEQITQAITQDLHNVAKAINLSFEKAILFFKSMENEMFSQRAIDFEDVRKRILHKVLLQEHDSFAELDADSIPIFSEISPSEVSLLRKHNVRAYLASGIGQTSHVGILSRALNIGCVSNLEDQQLIQEGDYIIVDGENSLVIWQPNDEALEYFAQSLQIEDLILQKEERLKDIESSTKDGRQIDIALNIGLPLEIDQVQELGSNGVGLFRTEFLFLDGDHLPTEEEQYQVYSEMAAKIAPKPITIRTFDLGGDKISHLIHSPHEDNPNLGNRGIRYCLTHSQILRTQLRAILRAAVHGNIRIMFPMIIDVDDFLEAKRILMRCADDLYDEKAKYNAEIPVGSMIEVPSAALSSCALARECDFLSIGTNDLVQYTLAVDRNNEAVSRYFIQHHPAVLMLIRATLINAARHNTPVSICGEMASTKEYIPLLIGMGVKELSVNSAVYYEVKSVVRNCDAKLHMIVKNFDFSTSLPKVDELVYRTLKPYYSSDRRDSNDSL